MNKRNFSIFGASSLLVIFTLLALVIFTLLTLQSANETDRLSKLSAQSEEEYSAAELEAHRILALIRAGTVPDGVAKDGDLYEYEVKINSSLTLFVKAELIEDDICKIHRWQSVRTAPWEADDTIDVWQPE